MNIEETTVIFWLNQPPKVEVGAYNYLSTKAKKTYYVCMHDYPLERKKLNWGNTPLGKAELIILPDNQEDRLASVQKFLKGSDSTTHIVCGFAGSMSDYISPMLKKLGIKFFVVSEKPRVQFDNLQDILLSIVLYIKYGIVKRLKYRKSIKALLPLGQLGIDQFAKLGWEKNKMFRFMYCGQYEKINISNALHKDKSQVRFLYIGRFGYNHALDIMMEAFDLLKDNNWQLDMAGGYGENKEEVFEWIEHHNNVNFIGKIEASKVRETMQNYDCLVVPSRLEGWNCQVCEALSVGCPVITHKSSVSSEIIEHSGAGLSVNDLSPKTLSAALEQIIETPQLYDTWREKALKFYPNISEERVGKYLIEIIEYVNNNSSQSVRPICPW